MLPRLSRRLALATALAVVVGGLAGAGPAASAALAATTVTPGAIRYADEPKAVPDSYIVVLKDTTAPQETERLAADLAAKYNGKVTFTYTSALQGFAITVGADQAALIAGEPQVDYVAQDQQVSLDTFVQPSPPSWGLDRIDEHSLPLDNKYHYPSTANTVRAFVIDTGILLTHSEIAGRATCGFDPWGGGCAPCGIFHGTHVASTIGGTTTGVAKGVQIISVRVFNCASTTTWAVVIAGVNYVTLAQTITPTAHSVANMSLSGPAYAPIDSAVTTSIANNVHYTVSAGNYNDNACLYSPARVPWATTVAATTITDNRASFSNWGPCVDVFAPGVNIVSASNTSTTAYTSASGTSMSAPHAAGTAALYRHRFPSESAYLVHNAIRNNATPGVVIGPGTGSPNLLLFSNMIPM